MSRTLFEAFDEELTRSFVRAYVRHQWLITTDDYRASTLTQRRAKSAYVRSGETNDW